MRQAHTRHVNLVSPHSHVRNRWPVPILWLAFSSEILCGQDVPLNPASKWVRLRNLWVACTELYKVLSSHRTVTPGLLLDGASVRGTGVCSVGPAASSRPRHLRLLHSHRRKGGGTRRADLPVGAAELTQAMERAVLVPSGRWSARWRPGFSALNLLCGLHMTIPTWAFPCLWNKSAHQGVSKTRCRRRRIPPGRRGAVE